MVRSPRGDLVAWGKSRARKECLQIGSEIAEEWAAEQLDTWQLDGDWRFLLWPPLGR